MADAYNGNRAFFANYGSMTLQVASDTSFTTVPAAAIKGVGMTPKAEHVVLFGMERLTRAAVAKHTLTVDVTLEYAMWDPDNDYVMQGVLLGHLATGSGITEANINDPLWKNKVCLFNITSEMIDTDALRKVVLVASDVYFESVPWEMKENEFISRSLSGTAKVIEKTTYKRTATSEAWVLVGSNV
jgi:hypothetical protein